MCCLEMWCLLQTFYQGVFFIIIFNLPQKAATRKTARLLIETATNKTLFFLGVVVRTPHTYSFCTSKKLASE